ncbi:hypothetical protein MCEMIE22_02580 [Mycobacteriaceae bacterium]
MNRAFDPEQPRYVALVRWYAPPDGDKQTLRVRPRLFAMDNSNHPSQRQLREFLDDTEDLVAGSRISGPWSLRLDVGLTSDKNLLDQSDLDNFAYPLAARLRDERLVSVWCTKQHNANSYVRIESACATHPPPVEVIVATPTASYSRPGGLYKQQVRAAVAGAPELPPGAIRLELAFIIGYTMNYLNLWKPTIDALGPLLGPGKSGGDWDPDDGRITELGMHVTIDPASPYGVKIGIAASTAAF